MAEGVSAGECFVKNGTGCRKGEVGEGVEVGGHGCGLFANYAVCAVCCVFPAGGMRFDSSKNKKAGAAVGYIIKAGFLQPTVQQCVRLGV